MTGKDQEKIRVLGVKIIRRDYFKMLIKYKDKEHPNWKVLEKFSKKIEVDNRMKELLESPLIIED